MSDSVFMLLGDVLEGLFDPEKAIDHLGVKMASPPLGDYSNRLFMTSVLLLWLFRTTKDLIVSILMFREILNQSFIGVLGGNKLRETNKLLFRPEQ